MEILIRFLSFTEILKNLRYLACASERSKINSADILIREHAPETCTGAEKGLVGALLR